MSKWNDEVRLIYEKDTGKRWLNNQYEPNLNYVEWLENCWEEKICQLSDSGRNAVLGDGWRDRSDKSYYNEKRILIFTSDYEDVTMRWRIIDSQFMDLCKEASHWKKLDEPTFS